MAKTADGPYTVWTPVDVTLSSDRQFDNPYTDVAVTATFEHESGDTHEIPGFWDGGTTWKVRFAPPNPGEWTWRTESDVADDGLSADGEFVAASYEGPNPIRKHGFLRVAKSGRHIVHEDGTPFFWLGDTVWSASAKATDAEWREYLTKRRSQGFSVVQLNSLPQYDASQPQRRLPFGEHWRLDRPNHDYFRTLDDLVEAAHRAGIVPALVVLWFNYVADDGDRSGPNTFSVEQAGRYGRYLGARYGAYGATWIVSGDTSDEGIDVYDAAARALEDSVTHPLLTAHTHSWVVPPTKASERDWFDFHMYQSGHHTGEGQQANAYRHVPPTREHDPDRPVLNGEPCYEQYAYFEEPEIRISREDARRAAWWSVLAGANAGVTYGAGGLWHWHRTGERITREHMPTPMPWDEAVELPGADDYTLLKSFLEDFEFGSLEPSQELLIEDDETVRAARLPEDGVALVYVPESRGVDVDPTAVEGPVSRVEWVDPATGRRIAAQTRGSDESLRIERPPWRGDAIAVVRA
jgi:hypothetical protein